MSTFMVSVFDVVTTVTTQLTSTPFTVFEAVKDMAIWDATPYTMRWLLPKFRQAFVFLSPGHEKGQSSGSRFFFRNSENNLPNLTDEYIIICLIFAYGNFRLVCFFRSQQTANIYFVYACFSHFCPYSARKFLTYICIYIYIYINKYTYTHIYIYLPVPATVRSKA